MIKKTKKILTKQSNIVQDRIIKQHLDQFKLVINNNNCQHLMEAQILQNHQYHQ